MRVLVALILSLPNIGAYAMLAVGIVMIYRASKVLNLAHGAMAMIPPYIVYTLNQGITFDVPLTPLILPFQPPIGLYLAFRDLGVLHIDFALPALVAVPLGIAAGGLLGYGVERIFVRRLRSHSVTAQTVGTVAALGVLVSLAAKVWGTTQLPAVRVFPSGFVNVSQSSIKYGELGLFAVMIVVTGLLLLLFQKTDLGLLMRGTAENRRAASLMGVDPDRITAFAWILGGSLAALAGIMLASVTNLHPYTLSLQALYAFVAALIAGLASLIGAVVGAAIVGTTLGLVPLLGPLGNVEGAPQFFLFVVAIAVMATRGRQLVASDVRELAVGRGEEGPKSLPYGRRPIALLGVVLFALVPFVVPFSLLGNVNRAAIFVLVAASLVLITGWVGQISLGHAALVGVGAYSTGWLAAGLGIPFPINVLGAGLIAAAVASLIGRVAVRVRGLYLAVATLIFSWMCDAFLFKQALFTRHFRIDSRPIGGEGSLPYFDFTNRKVFYFVAFALAALGLYAVANLRDSKTGRAFFAVRGSEVAASSLGIDVVKYKQLAFAISGFLAGVAGNLIMTDSRALSPDQFRFDISFFFLSIAVVGGASSLGGGVAAALLFAMLNELFFRVSFLGGFLDVTSAALLAVVLLVYPGGLAKLGSSITGVFSRRPAVVAALAGADRVLETFLADVRWASERVRTRTRERLVLAGLALPEGAVVPQRVHQPIPVPVIAGGAGDEEVVLLDEPSRSVAERLGDLPIVGRFAPTVIQKLAGRTDDHEIELLDYRDVVHGRRELPPHREDRALVLEARDITVRFGGLVAVNENSLEVREGEIVGLIGPNGAGKTVTFNTIAGIVTPTSGQVRLFGREVTEIPVHLRARMGVARTFQAIQLISQLTVFDNLLVATHLQNETGFLSHLFVTEGALTSERDARDRVERVVELLDLTDVAHQAVADLPFGILRMVEVARAMVTGFRFIMLDEPASGLDSSETERLTDVLLRVRDMGVTQLLIEHDVKMVTSVSDYMYVLERGTLIAQGPPEQIQRDPAVVAAYLGKSVDD